MPVAEARQLLGVPEDADRETINTAHRRLIARVHPDVGGSAELARRVNAARDILLSEVRNQAPRVRD
jgi:curved DNA-binding protein CbpA